MASGCMPPKLAQAALDGPQVRVGRGSAPGDEEPSDRLVRVRVARPSGSGGNPRGLVRAARADDPDQAPVSEAEVALVADRSLDRDGARGPEQAVVYAAAAPGQRRQERRYQGSAGSPAVHPPSTGSTTPVIAPASGLARKTIAPAISSGWSRRPSGMRRVAARTKVSFSKNAAVIGVTVKPGATAFTRTPCTAQSIASDRVSAATAPLLAVYAACEGSETSAACDATLTTEPAPALRSGANAWQAVQGSDHVHLVVAAEVVGRKVVHRLVLGEDAGRVDEDVQSVEPCRQCIERRAVVDVDRL